MAIKYPIGTRVKHKTLFLFELYGVGTVIGHKGDAHIIEVDGGIEVYALGEALEEVYG